MLRLHFQFSVAYLRFSFLRSIHCCTCYDHQTVLLIPTCPTDRIAYIVMAAVATPIGYPALFIRCDMNNKITAACLIFGFHVEDNMQWRQCHQHDGDNILHLALTYIIISSPWLQLIHLPHPPSLLFSPPPKLRCPPRPLGAFDFTPHSPPAPTCCPRRRPRHQHTCAQLFILTATKYQAIFPDLLPYLAYMPAGEPAASAHVQPCPPCRHRRSPSILEECRRTRSRGNSTGCTAFRSVRPTPRTAHRHIVP